MIGVEGSGEDSRQKAPKSKRPSVESSGYIGDFEVGGLELHAIRHPIRPHVHPQRPEEPPELHA